VEPQAPLTQAPARQTSGVVQAPPLGLPHVPSASQRLAAHWLLAVQLEPLGSRGTQVLAAPQ
jgi:hypothetical protein